MPYDAEKCQWEVTCPPPRHKQPTHLMDFGISAGSMLDARETFSQVLQHELGYQPPYFLELGAGKHAKDLPERVCVDIAYSEGIDIVWDLNYGIPLPDECVHTIHSNQTLEHIHNIIFLFNEMWRVLISGGTMWHAVPYYAGPHAWGDPDHVRAFSEQSFKYYCIRPGTDEPFVAAFSDYGIESRFELVKQEIKGGNQGLEVTLKKP